MSLNNRQWTKRVSRAVSEPHSSVLLIGIFYIIFFSYNLLVWMIGGKVIDLGFQLNAKILIAFILIFYLFIGLHHFVDRTKTAFSMLEGNYGFEGLIDKFKEDFYRVMVQPKALYALAVVVILSYIMIPPPDNSDFIYFSLEEGPWIARLLLDIINWSSTLLILYLMANILWITICVSWALGQMWKSLRYAVKIDLYSSDNVGGLAPLRNLILFLALFQFSSLSLAIANFSSKENNSLTVIFFITLFLFSVYLFLKGWFVIDELLEDRRANEVDFINRIFIQKKQLLMQAIIDKETRLKVDIDELSKSMDILCSERERLLNASKTVYDYKAILAFISSSLLPFITQYILPIS